MLKSYSSFKKKKSKKRKDRRAFGDLVTGGITALVGVSLVSQTANAISRI